MFWHGFPITGPWGVVSILVSILVTVILISVFVRIIIRIARGESGRYNHRRGDYCSGRDNASDNARTVLDERYAKGEISEEEYKRMRENLK